MNVNKKDINLSKVEIDAIIAERDHLNHERNNLIAEREHLHHERRRFLNSTSWQLTKPLRIISGLFKGIVKPKSLVRKIINRLKMNSEKKEEKHRRKKLDKYIKSGNAVSIKVLHAHINND